LTHNNPTMKAKFDDLPKGDLWLAIERKVKGQN
jgi:hypothetical protein